MANFNFTVDTAPMANEIAQVSNKVTQTTVAVVAMQSAVIAAEVKASDKVCDNLNRGFYTLIQSQISQKVARLKSDVDSHFMQLAQQGKALRNIEHRMTRDYNLITNRYAKLFMNLDSSLNNRIKQLDKAVVMFAEAEMVKLENRTKYLTATIPVTQKETLFTSQKLVASHTKNQAQKLIRVMNSFLSETLAQNKLMDKLLLKDTYITKEGFHYQPVAVCEYTINEKGEQNTDIYIPAMNMDNTTVSKVRNSIVDKKHQLAWKSTNRDDKVHDVFQRMIESSTVDKRVLEMMKKLYATTNYQTL